MPKINVNDITINYELDSPDSPSSANGNTIVLVNGLADDLQTWSAQIPAFLTAGYRVLRFDNRGIGLSSTPPGPYTAELLADDLHALLSALEIYAFHLLGVSMGGMIAQTYALKYAVGYSNGNDDNDDGRKLLSLSLCCTYAQPTPFCSRMFSLWADMARRMSVQDVMRDVTLWAFTVPFFRNREDELVEVEKAMAALDMSLEAYLAQLNVIQKFDSTAALEGLRSQGRGLLGGVERNRRVLVLAGRTDILIPVTLSRELVDKIDGAVFATCKGGHACLVRLRIYLGFGFDLLFGFEADHSQSFSGNSPMISTEPLYLSSTSTNLSLDEGRSVLYT